MSNCECNYSYVCATCQQVYDLQARDARVENRVDELEKRFEGLEERVVLLERLVEGLRR